MDECVRVNASYDLYWIVYMMDVLSEEGKITEEEYLSVTKDL